MPWYYILLIAIGSLVIGFVIGLITGLLSVQSKYDKLYEPCGKFFVTVDKRGVEHYNMHVDNLDALIDRKYALFIMSTPPNKPPKYIPYEELVEDVNERNEQK